MGFCIFSFSSLSAWCCVVAEAILLVVSGRPLSLFRFFAWLGYVTLFIITSVKLVSWFLEVCPLGNGFFNVVSMSGLGAVVYASFVWRIVCLFMKL